MEVIFTKYGGTAIQTMGYAIFKVFALPLQHPITKRIVWWIGKSSDHPDIRSAIVDVLKRAALNYTRLCEDIDVTYSSGCTSLIELLYGEIQYKVLQSKAFFFDLPGGNFGIVDNLKNFLRRLFEAPGHCKTISCVKMYTPQSAFIVDKVMAIDKMPKKHRAAALKLQRSIDG